MVAVEWPATFEISLITINVLYIAFFSSRGSLDRVPMEAMVWDLKDFSLGF